MKRVKRLFACLLALTMMLGLSATAFASSKEPSDVSSVKINKIYYLKGEGTSPAETFSFKVTKESVKESENTVTNMPDIGNFVIKYDEGDAKEGGTQKSFNLTLPSTQDFGRPGVYTYKIEEESSNTAGVDYDENKDVRLVVTVSYNDNGDLIRTVALKNGENKLGNDDNAFENTYIANKVNVTKKVTGNLGDKKREFTFKVKFSAPDGKLVNSTVQLVKSDGSKEVFGVEETKEFTLKDGATASITNLPKGVEYEITENDYSADKYVTYAENAEGTMDEGAITAKFTNSKIGEIDTGVYLDNLPYLLVFAGVLAIAAVFVVRRRRFED